MVYIIEFIRRNFFSSFFLIAIFAYIVLDHMGYGSIVTKHLSEVINTYLPAMKPHIESLKKLLNELKL